MNVTFLSLFFFILHSHRPTLEWFPNSINQKLPSVVTLIFAFFVRTSLLPSPSPHICINPELSLAKAVVEAGA
jgi:hypothetical protein